MMKNDANIETKPKRMLFNNRTVKKLNSKGFHFHTHFYLTKNDAEKVCVI